MNKPARCLTLALGAVTGTLGAIGAYQLQAAIDGPTSYLALAAPVVAATAAFLPYLAEVAWRGGHRFKAVALATVLIPAAAVVFFGAAERVHMSKAGAEAERLAAHLVVDRAETSLNEARTAANAATLAANRVRGLSGKRCGTQCLTVRANEVAASKLVAEREATLRAAQAGAVKGATLAAPVWLLPLALDLISFTLIWAGLGCVAPPPKKVATRKRPIARKRKPKAVPVAPAVWKERTGLTLH